jgi:hypothetical protein
MERSPDVRLHPWSIHHQLAEPLSVQAVCARMAGRDDDARRLAGEAVGLDPECTRAKELLDELGPPEEPLGPLDPIGREEVGMMPVELKKDLVSFDVAAIDRLLDSGEALQALERFEYLGQVADLVMVRELFADSTVLIRLAGVVAPHPARRRRFEAVLARLDDVTKGARG